MQKGVPRNLLVRGVPKQGHDGLGAARWDFSFLRASFSGAWRMPWRQMATKDAASGDIPRRGAGGP
jgi:hypothetical protein